ncbi:MAG: hypothetical protein ACRECM_04895, partial [Methyloceanibacter sp.]
ELMIDLCGISSSVAFVPQEAIYGTSYEDIPRRVPDISRMREILGVIPQVSLEDGLRRTVDWFRAQAVEG